MPYGIGPPKPRPKPPPPPPLPNPPRGPLSDALSTRIVRPSNLVHVRPHCQQAIDHSESAIGKRKQCDSYSTLFMVAMAFWASPSWVYRTNPKPRLRPVSRSLTTTFPCPLLEAASYSSEHSHQSHKRMQNQECLASGRRKERSHIQLPRRGQTPRTSGEE